MTKLNKLPESGAFLNFKPKIGFFEDDTVANVFGTFDISSLQNYPVAVISDNRLREIMYHFVNDGSYGKVKTLHKSIKITENSPWQHYNKEVRPPYLTANQAITAIASLGNDYMIQKIQEGTVAEWWLVDTFGSSLENEWKKKAHLTGNLNVIYAHLGSIYFSEYDTLFRVYASGWLAMYSITKVSTATVIKTGTLVDLNNILDWSRWTTVNKVSFYGGQQPVTSVYGGAIYNEDDKQLVVFAQLGFSTGILDGVSTGAYSQLFLPFKVSTPTFFKDGVGTLTFNMSPFSDYKMLTAEGGVKSSASNFFISYDKYQRCTYYCELWSGDTTYGILKSRSKNRPQKHNYFIADALYSKSSTSDASPWAKRVLGIGYIHNGVIYFYGNSDRYGANHLASEYNPNSFTLKSAEAYLNLVPNTWWLSSKEEQGNPVSATGTNTTHIRATETTMRYIAFGSNYTLWEINHVNFMDSSGKVKKGKRQATPLINPIPSLDSAKYSALSMCYDPIRNRAYFLVWDKLNTDPNKQGFIFLLVWANNTFTEYRNIPVLEEYCQWSIDSLKTTATMLANSNFFIDLDGKVYFNLRFGVVGDSKGHNFFCIDLNSNPVMTKKAIIGWGSHGLNMFKYVSYDNDVGYHVFAAGGERIIVSMSKSIIKGANYPNKTVEQFFNGDIYYSFLDLQGSVGLIAYLQPTSVYLGGYYSETGVEEIPLEANSDNYIYLERDGSDNNKINVVTSTRLIGGEKGFNRVLVSKITTDSHFIINQVDYPVTWDY